MILRIRWKHLAAFVFAAMLLPVASRAAEGTPAGTWKGTLGKAAVMVCFSESGVPQYYYLRHRRGIRLQPSEASNTEGNGLGAIANHRQGGWFRFDEFAPGEEGGRGARWLLQAKSSTEIIGTWTAPHQDKTLPIALRKVASVPPVGLPGAVEDCDQAYYEPIVKGMRLSFRPAKFASRTYREVSSEQATSLEVPAKSPHAQALNRYAMRWLRDQSIRAYDCNTSSGFKDAEPIGSSLKPVLWTNRYLVLEDRLPEIYCGGAHGSSSLSYLTWSWSQSRLVDTWAWLQGGEKSLVLHATREGQPIKSGLFRLIAKLYPLTEESDVCRNLLDLMNIEAPYPTARGLVFNTSFSHAARACDERVTLEWKRLRPYLSNEGRTVADQFRR